jgi:flagellar biosynthesis chaperone FliJ
LRRPASISLPKKLELKIPFTSKHIPLLPKRLARGYSKTAEAVEKTLYENAFLRTFITSPVNALWLPFGKRILAWQVAKHEHHERQEKLSDKEEELAAYETITPERRSYNVATQIERLRKEIRELREDRGFLRIGLPLYRECHDFIDTLDSSISASQLKLSIWQRNRLNRIDTAPRDLAYIINDQRRSLRTLKEDHAINRYDEEEINADTYVPSAFHKKYKKFVETHIDAHTESEVDAT